MQPISIPRFRTPTVRQPLYNPSVQHIDLMHSRAAELVPKLTAPDTPLGSKVTLDATQQVCNAAPSTTVSCFGTALHCCTLLQPLCHGLALLHSTTALHYCSPLLLSAAALHYCSPLLVVPWDHSVGVPGAPSEDLRACASRSRSTESCPGDS